MTPPRIIGLSGYAGTGKDSFGNALINTEFRYTRLSFADTIRDTLLALDPLVIQTTRLSTMVEADGWEQAKRTNAEVRRLLQRLGTEGGRNILGENIWVDAAMRQVDADPVGHYVFTDVRFPNEAQAIQDRGGAIVRIARPGITAGSGHLSETALDDWEFDGYFFNDTKFVDTMRGRVREFVTSQWLYVGGRVSAPAA